MNPLKWLKAKYKAWSKEYYSVEASCKRHGYVEWAEYECLLEERNLKEKE